MNPQQIEIINNDIKRTRRAIIALGCSFTHGHGSLNEKIYKSYPHQFNKNTGSIDWDLSLDQKKELVNEFRDIKISHGGQLDFTEHENNNSFAKILATKYFKKGYATINLGRNGGGNRAAIKELYFYPNILWDLLREIIVIFCPTGPERLDFMDDQYHQLNYHGRWKTIWPQSFTGEQPITDLCNGYNNALFSHKFTTLEQIANIQELLLWCKHKRANLIITPAFNTNYSVKEFTKALSTNIIRDSAGKIIKEERKNYDDVTDMVNMWPWEKMFYPEGHSTFVDLLMSREFGDRKNEKYFYEFIGTGTPNKWITPCCHPSIKGHDLFAQLLYKHITEKL